MVRDAAIKIRRALSVFDNEPERIRENAMQFTMERVTRLVNGTRDVIEGEGLVTEIPEEVPEETINTPEQKPGEESEAL